MAQDQFVVLSLLPVESSWWHGARTIFIQGWKCKLEMEELSHDLGNPAPPRLDEGVQDVSKSQINQWTVLDDKDKEVLPGVRSGEGRVAAHEETDQQSEHDKFCLTLHLDLNISDRIKTNIMFRQPVLIPDCPRLLQCYLCDCPDATDPSDTRLAPRLCLSPGTDTRDLTQCPPPLPPRPRPHHE